MVGLRYILVRVSIVCREKEIREFSFRQSNITVSIVTSPRWLSMTINLSIVVQVIKYLCIRQTDTHICNVAVSVQFIIVVIIAIVMLHSDSHHADRQCVRKPLIRAHCRCRTLLKREWKLFLRDDLICAYMYTLPEYMCDIYVNGLCISAKNLIMKSCDFVCRYFFSFISRRTDRLQDAILL